MLLNRPDLCSRFEVWAPKYSTQYSTEGEWCVLIPVYKIDDASPIFRVQFTKAKHLRDLRFAMSRKDAQAYPITQVKNKRGGITPMYTIPLSKFETWETPAEVKAIAFELFPD